MSIFRNSDGFSLRNEGESTAAYADINPFKYHTLYENFARAVSGIPYGWLNDNSSGTPTIASGPLLVQTLGGSDNHYSHMYAATATFALVAGKKAFFRWRGKVDIGGSGVLGEEEIYIGLGAVQLTTNFVVAGGTSLVVDDWIGFASYDGSATIGAVARKTDVESSETGVTSYADATFMELGFDFDGTTATFYKDLVKLTALNTNIPIAAVTPMILIKAGEAIAKVLSTSYLFVAVER